MAEIPASDDIIITDEQYGNGFKLDYQDGMYALKAVKAYKGKYYEVWVYYEAKYDSKTKRCPPRDKATLLKYYVGEREQAIKVFAQLLMQFEPDEQELAELGLAKIRRDYREDVPF